MLIKTIVFGFALFATMSLCAPLRPNLMLISAPESDKLLRRIDLLPCSTELNC